MCKQTHIQSHLWIFCVVFFSKHFVQICNFKFERYLHFQATMAVYDITIARFSFAIRNVRAFSIQFYFRFAICLLNAWNSFNTCESVNRRTHFSLSVSFFLSGICGYGRIKGYIVIEYIRMLLQYFNGRVFTFTSRTRLSYWKFCNSISRSWCTHVWCA